MGVGVEGGLEDADGFGGGEGDVGVEEEEVFAFGVGEGEVVAAGEAEVGGGAEEGDAGGDVEGGLGGVVDDDDLGFGEVAEDGVEAPGQQLGVVPGDDDDGEARAHGYSITKWQIGNDVGEPPIPPIEADWGPAAAGRTQGREPQIAQIGCRSRAC